MVHRICLSLCLVALVTLVDCKSKCEICQDFSNAFKKEFERTSKSNYAGGDTAWEEEKLGSYANSEVRFVEIMEKVCKHSDNDCHSFVSYNEEAIEEWWSSGRHKSVSDMKTWLCVNHAKTCCPENTFGKNCEPCPGGVEKPCGGHGTCKGAGERDGEGTCSCSKEYNGTLCDQCAVGYYNDSDRCISCHMSCEAECFSPGPKGCAKCKDGWKHDPEIGCKDINECVEDTADCDDDTYCQNKPGSYSCISCDFSCQDGCTGPGNRACEACASGYREEDGACLDNDECSENETLCKEGTYCANSPGSYKCQACHVSCKLSCTGPGKGGCDECRQGYEQLNGSCEDINECETDEPPCDSETETCDNLPGSFMCRCKPNYEKVNGKCTVKKIQKKKSRKPKEPVEGNDEERENYSFFHVLGPLLIAAGICRYTKPNLFVSLGLIVVVILTSTLH